MKARRRLETFLDAEGQVEIAAELEPMDKLKFRDSKNTRIVYLLLKRTVVRKTL